MCSTKENRTTGTGRGTHHGHCKGNSFMGTSRRRTKALTARTCCTDTPKQVPLNRASRGHLTIVFGFPFLAKILANTTWIEAISNEADC